MGIDATINDRGIYVDEELTIGAIKIDKAARTTINAELNEITAGVITSVSQEEKLLAWLGAHRCALDNIQKITIGQPSKAMKAKIAKLREEAGEKTNC